MNGKSVSSEGIMMYRFSVIYDKEQKQFAVNVI
jgi:hypothetical protein